MMMLKRLAATLRAEAAFIVLLAVAGAGAWLYVQYRQMRADRDEVTQRAELICAAAHTDFAVTGRLKRGEACRLTVAGLADFKAHTVEASAKVLADAIADHDARARRDGEAARTTAEMMRDTARRMETADAEAERRNLVDREWTAAVNRVAGLRPAR